MGGQRRHEPLPKVSREKRSKRRLSARVQQQDGCSAQGLSPLERRCVGERHTTRPDVHVSCVRWARRRENQLPSPRTLRRAPACTGRQQPPADGPRRRAQGKTKCEERSSFGLKVWGEGRGAKQSPHPPTPLTLGARGERGAAAPGASRRRPSRAPSGADASRCVRVACLA
jgi:hypothetical protein